MIVQELPDVELSSVAARALINIKYVSFWNSEDLSGCIRRIADCMLIDANETSLALSWRARYAVQSFAQVRCYCIKRWKLFIQATRALHIPRFLKRCLRFISGLLHSSFNGRDQRRCCVLFVKACCIHRRSKTRGA